MRPPGEGRGALRPTGSTDGYSSSPCVRLSDPFLSVLAPLVALSSAPLTVLCRSCNSRQALSH